MVEELSSKEGLLETVSTGFQEQLALLEAQEVKVDVAFVKDEYEDIIERWEALSAATRDLLKTSKKEKQRKVTEDVSSVEEAIVEAQVVETEAEPVDWNILLSDPSYASKIDVRYSALFSRPLSMNMQYAALLGHHSHTHIHCTRSHVLYRVPSVV